MRQLASMLVDGKLRYYMADAETGEIEEVAVVKPAEGWRASPEAVIGMGFGIAHEAGYNGRRRPAVAKVEQPALPAAPPQVESNPSKPRRRSFTIEDLLKYVAKHPGATAAEIGDTLAPGLTHKQRRVMVKNRLIAHQERCARTGEPVRLITEGGGPGKLNHYYVVDETHHEAAPVTG